MEAERGGEACWAGADYDCLVGVRGFLLDSWGRGNGPFVIESLLVLFCMMDIVSEGCKLGCSYALGSGKARGPLSRLGNYTADQCLDIVIIPTKDHSVRCSLVRMH